MDVTCDMMQKNAKVCQSMQYAPYQGSIGKVLNITGKAPGKYRESTFKVLGMYGHIMKSTKKVRGKYK